MGSVSGMKVDLFALMARPVTMFLVGGMLISQPVLSDCESMELVAHRGAPGHPENSLSGVKAAASGAWTGVEVDAQLLGSGEWVLHHDYKTGRTTSIAGRTVSSLNSLAWSEVRLRARSGAITSEPAPFIKDILPALSPGRVVLNVEIKVQNLGCPAINRLLSELRAGLPAGNWHVSALDRSVLRCVRKSDPGGYLGLVVLDPRSIAREGGRKERAGALLDGPRITEQSIDGLLSELRPPLGLHLDVLTLRTQPAILLWASQKQVPVFVYAPAGDEELADSLAFVAERVNMLPSGVIIDGSPEAFCGRFRVER